MPAKKTALSYEAMVEHQQNTKATRIYKQSGQALTAAGENISASVLNALNMLLTAQAGEHVHLNDTTQVKSITVQYLRACAETGTIPTMVGLCLSMGRTRSDVYKYIANHANHTDATTEWLESFRELCSDVLSQNALNGTVHPIVSIFLQKALYGLRDTVSIETVQDNGRDPEAKTAADYRKMYGSLTEAEGESAVYDTPAYGERE